MNNFRSIEKVEQELRKMGIPVAEIECGIVKFREKLNTDQSQQLKTHLPELGFEVLDPMESELLDRASLLIKEFVYDKPQISISDYPAYIEQRLECAELKLNRIFTQVLGVSICQCARIQQVERMKELILYENFDLGQVAQIFHLEDESAVTKIFQSITGLMPGFFNQLKKERKRIQDQTFGTMENNMCFKAINTAN